MMWIWTLVGFVGVFWLTWKALKEDRDEDDRHRG
jgi:hypothetical protein